MSNQKISAMTPLAGADLSGADQLPIVHSGANDSITITELVKGLPVNGTLDGSSGTLSVVNLVGDVTGPVGTTVVATVGGSTAASVHTSQLATVAATASATASTLMKRDGSGNVAVAQLSSASATPCSFGGVSAITTSTITDSVAKAALNALCVALGITTA